MTSRLLTDLAAMFAAESRAAEARNAHDEAERLHDISDELLARSDDEFRAEFGIL